MQGDAVMEIQSSDVLMVLSPFILAAMVGALYMAIPHIFPDMPRPGSRWWEL
jgi:hypothetical protein